MTSRRSIVNAAFEALLDFSQSLSSPNMVSSRTTNASEVISPELFLFAVKTISVTSFPKHSQAQTEYESQLKADIAAEFLIEEDVASRGITRDFAIRRFEQQRLLPCLSKVEWDYFFGVEDPPAATNASPNVLGRSVVLLPSAVGTLTASLRLKDEYERSRASMVRVEDEARGGIVSDEADARSTVESKFRRQMYAISLRQRLKEDSELAEQQNVVRAVDAAAVADAAEVQKLRWEQRAVLESLELTRTSQTKLEHALRTSEHVVSQCGAQWNAFKEWKAKLLEVTCAELKDSFTSTSAYADITARAIEDRISAVESKLMEVGRLAIVSHAAAHGRLKHTELLESLVQKHNGTGDFSYLALPPRLDTQGYRHAEADDEVDVASLMLRDVTLFTPSLQGPHHNDPTGFSSSHSETQFILRRCFDRLCSAPHFQDSAVPPRNGIPFSSFCVIFEHIDAHLKRHHRHRRVAAPRLEFEAYADIGSTPKTSTAIIGWTGWLRYARDQACFAFAEAARYVSVSVLLDLFSTEVILPFLSTHTKAIDADLRSVSSSLTSPYLLSSTVRFDLDDCLKEATGALLAEGWTIGSFLEAFDRNVGSFRGFAPIKNQPVSCMTLISCAPHDRCAHEQAFIGCPALIDAADDALMLWVHSVKSMSLSGEVVLDASLDACTAWLHTSPGMDNDDCPDRQHLLLLLGDIIVRVIRQSCHLTTIPAESDSDRRSQRVVSLRSWTVHQTSELLFKCASPAVLDDPKRVADERVVTAMECTSVPAVLFMASVVVLSYVLPESCSLDTVLSGLLQRRPQEAIW